MKTPSLTRRLIWILTLAAVVLWLLAALLAANTLRIRLNDAFDGGLKETAERILSLAADSLHDEPGERPEHDGGREIPMLDDGGGGEYIVYQVRASDGTILLRSHDAPTAAFAVPLAAGFADAGPWRVYTVGDPTGLIYTQVAEANVHRAESLWSSVLALFWPIALLVPLSALGIFAAVRTGLRPVRQFSVRIGEQHAANLSAVSDDGLPAELQPIARAVNGLIDRVGAALEAERSFASNSAHELRTPIAGSLAQTQRLIAELGDSPARDRALQIEASLRRLEHLSEKLLQLSRAEAGLGAVAAPVDLLPALKVVVEDFGRRLPPERLTFAVAPDADLRAPMDVDAFGIAVRNLLENARLYGDAAEPISVTASSGQIEIRNGGPAVSAEKLATLKRRFVRGSSQAQGAGLGLAIVESLVRQAGGQLDLLSPLPDRSDGFLARIVLPPIIGTTPAPGPRRER
jgi:two-component system OmpR family sensor kinase